MSTAPAPIACWHCEQDAETVPASYTIDVDFANGYEGGPAVPVCDTHLTIAAESGALVSQSLLAA